MISVLGDEQVTISLKTYTEMAEMQGRIKALMGYVKNGQYVPGDALAILGIKKNDEEE